MLRRIIFAKLAAAERQLGESLDYARHIARTSLPAFFKFARVLPLAEYQRTLPDDVAAVARLVATRDADCGTCVQIGVNLARQAGVADELLRAVVDAAPERLPAHLARVYRFAEAVVRATGEEDALREELRAELGEEGLVELALAIASCRVFPVVKRALGYATSCSAMTIRV